MAGCHRRLDNRAQTPRKLQLYGFPAWFISQWFIFPTTTAVTHREPLNPERQLNLTQLPFVFLSQAVSNHNSVFCWNTVEGTGMSCTFFLIHQTKPSISLWNITFYESLTLLHGNPVCIGEPIQMGEVPFCDRWSNLPELFQSVPAVLVSTCTLKGCRMKSMPTCRGTACSPEVNAFNIRPTTTKICVTSVYGAVPFLADGNTWIQQNKRSLRGT